MLPMEDNQGSYIHTERKQNADWQDQEERKKNQCLMVYSFSWEKQKFWKWTVTMVPNNGNVLNVACV